MIFEIIFDRASFSWMLGKEAAFSVLRTYWALVTLNLNHCNSSWPAPTETQNRILRG